MKSKNTQGIILNWKRQPEDQRDFVSQRHLQAPTEIPTEFVNPQIPIYDQGNIGSCVGNTVCACFRFEAYQLLKDYSFNPSRLFAYYNARLVQGWQNEDSGAYVRDGFKVLNKYGVAVENDWPYNTNDFAKKPTPEVYTKALNNLAVEYAAVPQTLDAIKRTLVSGAFVGFGFDVYSSFFGNWSNTTGDMPIPKKGERLEGGHAVTIVGYSDAKQSFYVQNSWGTAWGKNGYFWMPYSYALSKNASDFWCIEKIKIEQTSPAPVNPTNKDLIISIFKTKAELISSKESIIVNVGNLLGLPVDIKLSKNQNVDIVSKVLYE